jgi:phenylpyruvate tautomerase PptA (4-oxalocrotonate tautomerase family)
MPVVNIQMFEGRDSAKAQIAKDVTETQVLIRSMFMSFLMM